MQIAHRIFRFMLGMITASGDDNGYATNVNYGVSDPHSSHPSFVELRGSTADIGLFTIREFFMRVRH